MDARLIAAISGSVEGLNVAGMCRQLGISRQSFYKWQVELTRLRGHLILEATPEKGAHVGSSVEISG